MPPLIVFALTTMTPLWPFLIGREHRRSLRGHRLAQALEAAEPLVHTDKGCIDCGTRYKNRVLDVKYCCSNLMHWPKIYSKQRANKVFESQSQSWRPGMRKSCNSSEYNEIYLMINIDFIILKYFGKRLVKLH